MSKNVMINEVGNKYGLLTVRWRSLHKKGSNAVWHCECECGGTKEVKGVDLRKGYVKCCGCISKRRPHYGAFIRPANILDFYDDDIL